MKGIRRLSGLTMACIVGFGTTVATSAPAQATQTQVDAPATYTTTIVINDLDARGNVIGTETIKGQPQPIGTSQTIKGSARPLLDSGLGGLPTASGCRSLTVTNKTTTTLGFTAFKFITETSWCWNLNQDRTTLNSVQVRVQDVDGQYYYRGLNNSFNQNIAHGKRVYRQGFFENCIVHYGCINAYYPSNDSRVYSSGIWTWTTNG
jgi:hypothetical protein